MRSRFAMTPSTNEPQDIQQQILIELRELKQEVEQFNHNS
jgi:hypothetical protein